jgi:holo-[acyl-carrier protein] synthase
MIVGTGVDLAEVPRIRASIERFGARFTERIYTPAEIAYVERKANRWERYAARFAAKEAGMKAIGTGWRRGVRWQDFEVANLPSGKPTLRLHGVGGRRIGRPQRFAIAHTHGGTGDGSRDSGGLARAIGARRYPDIRYHTVRPLHRKPLILSLYSALHYIRYGNALDSPSIRPQALLNEGLTLKPVSAKRDDRREAVAVPRNVCFVAPKFGGLR